MPLEGVGAPEGYPTPKKALEEKQACNLDYRGIQLLTLQAPPALFPGAKDARGVPIWSRKLARILLRGPAGYLLLPLRCLLSCQLWRRSRGESGDRAGIEQVQADLSRKFSGAG